MIRPAMALSARSARASVQKERHVIVALSTSAMAFLPSRVNPTCSAHPASHA